VIAPPYDVIDAHLRESFLSKCPYNIVQIDLPIGGEDRYEKAAEAYKTWKETGVLVKDPEPAYYIYEQEYEYNGKNYTRTGFVGVMKLVRVWERKSHFPMKNLARSQERSI